MAVLSEEDYYDYESGNKYSENALFQSKGSELVLTDPGVDDDSVSTALPLTQPPRTNSPLGLGNFFTSTYNVTEFFGIDVDNNETNATYGGEPHFPEYIRVVSTCFCSVVLIVGVFGNILVPVVILKNRDMRNSTNYFLMNLSLADLLVLLVCLPAALVELHSPPQIWVLGKAMCLIVPFLEAAVTNASVLSLVFISVERYQVICRPLQAGYRCTRAKAILAITAIWTTGLVSAGPMLFLTMYDPETPYHDGSRIPTCYTPITEPWKIIYFLVTMVVFFLLPLLLLLGLYSVIIRQLLADTYELTHKKNSPQMRARRQVVVMLATVVTFFFICLFPLRIFFVWLIASKEEDIYSLGIEAYYNITWCCRVIFYLNSCINPILYVMTSSRFKTAFLRVFGIRHRLRRQDTYTNTSCNHHSVANSQRLNYGTNCSLVYKSMYSKTGVTHQLSIASTT
ncbi:unnamed protein product, partial [Meganyctiphanes norvegica]